MKKIGLALGEGGARGIAHISYLKVLDELDIKPSVISGSSMGAIIGALYASGKSAKELEKVLESLGIMEFNNFIDFRLEKGGIIKGNGVYDFLTDVLPAKNIEDLDIPLKIVATDYWKKESVIFESGNLVDAIRASISIPGVFKPFEKDSRLLIDGGCTNPVPFDIIRNDCDVLIAIDVMEDKKPKKPSKFVPNLAKVLFNTYYIMMAAITEEKLKNTKVEIFERPNIEDIKILDFYKYEKIISNADKGLDSFKAKLKKLLQED